MKRSVNASYIGQDADGRYRRKLDRGLLKLTEHYWRQAKEYRKGNDAFEANRKLVLSLMKKHRPELGGLPMGVVLLRYFLAERGITMTDFNRMCGFGTKDYRRTIKVWLNGVCPSLASAALMEMVTEGLVPMESWLIGGPELRQGGSSSGARRAIAARKIVASRLIKLRHLRHRAALVRMTRDWVNDLATRFKLDGVTAPEYRVLREYGIATGQFQPHQRYRRYDYEDPSTPKQAKDFRCLVDGQGRPVPPGDYDAQLERHSLEAALKRKEWHETQWRARDERVAARRERLERRRRGGGDSADSAAAQASAADEGDGRGTP